MTTALEKLRQLENLHTSFFQIKEGTGLNQEQVKKLIDLLSKISMNINLAYEESCAVRFIVNKIKNDSERIENYLPIYHAFQSTLYLTIRRLLDNESNAGVRELIKKFLKDNPKQDTFERKRKRIYKSYAQVLDKAYMHQDNINFSDIRLSNNSEKQKTDIGFAKMIYETTCIQYCDKAIEINPNTGRLTSLISSVII